MSATTLSSLYDSVRVKHSNVSTGTWAVVYKQALGDLVAFVTDFRVVERREKNLDRSIITVFRALRVRKNSMCMAMPFQTLTNSVSS